MTTLARQHFQRVMAARHAASNDHPNASAYELMLAKLAEDRRRLKGVQSMERKAEVKREILPDYLSWVEGVLAEGKGRQDDVLTTVMVWRMDAGDFAGGLEIAGYVLAHGLTLPDRFERTTATLIAEEVADAAKRAWDAKQPFDPDILLVTLELTQGHDMPDQVLAKLHKEIGLRQEDDTGLDHLRRAHQLHDGVGVKKAIERLERLLKNKPAPSDSDAAG